MPGKVKVKILSGKNLPVMDRSSDTTDAYVEIKLGNTTYKTDVCRRTLNPQWNTDWYRFEVDDSELQDEPLQIRLMDHDTYSANDAIGKVYLNLNPLLLPATGQLDTSDHNLHHEISGWIPVYDTMHGIRGEVNVTVKVELFSDFNRFRQSSCGVQFFYSSTIPHGYQAKVINGFVEELIVYDDPEYQWIDKIRTPRASNEARQTLFFKLSGKLQRKIGVKALGLGGNAVIGYRQCFDLEGESGIVARGIGTAVTLVKLHSIYHVPLETKEEDIENYLKFVGDGKSFSLCSTSPPHKSQSSLSHFNLAHSNLLPQPICARKLLTKTQFPSMDSVMPSSVSYSGLSDEKSMIGLLSQEEKRGKSAMSRRFERFKHSQKSLSKKMIALKAKINDSIGEEVDDVHEIPLDKRKLFKRTSSDSSAMAEILARSVMRATTSLSCILENQPNVTNEEETMEKLKPIENLLNQTGEFEEIPSDAMSTSSDSSSFCSDYEYRTYNNTANDVETISNIISNVEKLQKCLSREGLHKQFSLPAIPTKGFSLSSLDNLSQFDSQEPVRAGFKYPPILQDRRASDDYDSRENLPTQRIRKLERFEEIDLSEDSVEFESPLKASMNEEVSESTPRSEHGKLKFSFKSSIKSKKSGNNTMVNTALKTMLFERANILGTPAVLEPQKELIFPTSPQSHTVPEDIVKTTSGRVEILNTDGSNVKMPLEEYIELHKKESESKGIVKTALETMLIERADLLGTHEVENVQTGLISSNDNAQSRQENLNVNVGAHLEKINIESKGMVETAMQTMLLEKFNLLGTYTPPTSPKLLETGSFSNRSKSFTFSEEKRWRTMPKSMSSVSLGDEQQPKDTVLGMPFVSLSSLESNGDANMKHHGKLFFSDSHLQQPIGETLKDKASAKSKVFRFFRSKSGEHRKHNVFQKFRRTSKKSLNDDNIFTRIFHSRHDEKKDEETQTSNETFPQTNCTKILIDPPKPPDPIDLASGDFLAHSKTKSACITSHHSSPAQDRPEPDESNQEVPLRITNSPVKVNYMVPLHRRSSDSDLSVTPKGNSLTGSDKSVGHSAGYFMKSNYFRRGQLNQEPFDLLEYPFLTMTKFPPKFVIQIGGSIASRSVKLLERILNVDEPDSRDIWWSELRMEIRSHARSMNCNAVIGYTELTTICEDVCVLSACGTAAVIDFTHSTGDDDNLLNVQLIPKNNERDKQSINGHRPYESPDNRSSTCKITHLPYDEKTIPLKSKISKCPMCRKRKVPEVLIATIEPPDWIPSSGRGGFLESHVSRPLKDVKGEGIAKEISDGLPFLEYELHRLLLNKLKIRGMNSIFSFKIRISVGEKMLVGVATGTAMYLQCLPPPDIPVLVTAKVSDEKFVADLQEILGQTVKKNRETYQIKEESVFSKPADDIVDSDEEQPCLDISCGHKDCCVLELDDPDDAEVLKLVMQEQIPDGFHVVSTESVPGLNDLEIVKNLQMFTQIYRAKLTPTHNLQKHFMRILQSIYFKLRRMVPCALCDLQFRIDVPEPDEIQLCVIGMALGLGKKSHKRSRSHVNKKLEQEDLIFKIDDEDNQLESLNKSNSTSFKYGSTRSSPSKHRINIDNERHGVDITPLSYVPGGNIEQYLGNLNFFFIRETTSIREEGGLSGFIHSFLTEVLAIVRSHVTALGGNALVAFFMTECVLNHNLHKNQGQCLINVGGDVVSVSYFKNET